MCSNSNITFFNVKNKQQMQMQNILIIKIEKIKCLPKYSIEKMNTIIFFLLDNLFLM